MSKTGTLVDCALWQRGDTPGQHPACYWFQMPAEPGSAQAAAERRQMLRAAELFKLSPRGRELQQRIDELAAAVPTVDR